MILKKEFKLIFIGGYQFTVSGEFTQEDLDVLAKAFKGKYRYTVDTICIDFSQVACMIFQEMEVNEPEKTVEA